MGDWKTQLGKHPNYQAGGGSLKKCACGREINRPGTDICGVCYKKRQEQGTSQGSFSASSKLREGYLAGGYFVEKSGRNYIREDVFIQWAKDVSGDLKVQTPAMTSAAIRRFFSKLRAIEYKFKMNRDFDLAREGIYAFARDVAYTENRGVTPVLFSRFIEANIAEAKKSAEHFRAFVEHFQSVVAYFKDK